MTSIRKLICEVCWNASPSIPSTASMSSCPGTFRSNLNHHSHRRPTLKYVSTYLQVDTSASSISSDCQCVRHRTLTIELTPLKYLRSTQSSNNFGQIGRAI